MKAAEDRVAFWRGHWHVWGESGLSQRVYFARAGLSYPAFGYWRNRVKVPEIPATAAAPAFVPVVVECPEATPVGSKVKVPTAPEGDGGIDIRVAHGRTIRVAADFNEALLARVIRVLEQVPC